jgi:hypothetical protein
LEGIKNVSFIGGDLKITNNLSLSECEAQSICDYLVTPNGDIVIENNASGCNSQQEVEESCASSIHEIGVVSIFSCTPNPFTTSTTLSYELQQPETVSLSIYNHLGQLIYQTQEQQSEGTQQLIWNAERFSEGVYYYRLQVDDAVANGKMVKVK